MDIKMERIGYDPLYCYTTYRCPSCGEPRYYPGDIAFVEEQRPVCYCKSSIPDVESSKKSKLNAKDIVVRSAEIYIAFRNHISFDAEQAFEMTKLIMSAEIQHELSKM